MNLFEGELRSDGTFASKDLGVTAAVGQAGDAGPAWIAIRPEKITMRPRLDGEDPDSTAVAGAVGHVAYLGGESAYEVDLASGRRVQVRRRNVDSSSTFEPGQPVWLSWPASAPMILKS